jgi:hypothetical protein
MYLCMLRCGNVVLLTIRFYDLAHFTTPIPLSSLIPFYLLFQIVGLKISPVPNFVLKSANNIFMSYFYNWGGVEYIVYLVLC